MSRYFCAYCAASLEVPKQIASNLSKPTKLTLTGNLYKINDCDGEKAAHILFYDICSKTNAISESFICLPRGVYAIYANTRLNF